MTERFKARIFHDFEGHFVCVVGHILLVLTQALREGLHYLLSLALWAIIKVYLQGLPLQAGPLECFGFA